MDSYNEAKVNSYLKKNPQDAEFFAGPASTPAHL